MTSTQQTERAGTDANPEGSTLPTETAVSLGDDDGPLPVDELFGLLKNERRRLTLGYLRQHDEPVSLGELAESIASHENDKPEAQLNAMERKRVYVGLYQCHLPMMDDRGAVDFNKPRGRIRRGENFEVFERYLDDVGPGGSAGGTPWHRLYLLLSGVGAALFGTGLVVSDPPFTRLAFGALVGGFALCALLNWRDVRADSD